MTTACGLESSKGGGTDWASSNQEPQARTAAEAGTGANVKTGATEAEAAAEATPEVERWPLTEAPVARRRRTVVLAGAAVSAALVATALLVNLVPDEGDDGQGGTGSVGAASPSVDESPSASKPSDAKGRSASPSASRSGSPTVSPSASASRSGGAGAGADQGGGAEDGATAPSVAVDPYEWEGPCSQHYLVDKEPEQVVPPPSEPNARGWVDALGAVAGGQQMLALNVQGTGKATVVLEKLHVRVVEKSAPLDWNDFAMGVGCGGNVETTAFAVNLDAGRPAVSPKAGQRDFPYKVSESDPEVFYVFADTRAHNVSWYLELDWSSGDKQGTVRVDDNGNPFRTSGNVGRPAYNYPLGGSEWARDEWNPNIPG